MISIEELQKGWRNAGARLLRQYRSKTQRTPTDAQSFNRQNHLGLTYLDDQETLVVNDDTSDILYVAKNIEVSATINILGASSARVEFSLAPISEIKAGNGDFAPWDPGDVSSEDSDVINEPINAVRLVANGGEAEAHLKVRPH